MPPGTAPTHDPARYEQGDSLDLFQADLTASIKGPSIVGAKSTDDGCGLLGCFKIRVSVSPISNWFLSYVVSNVEQEEAQSSPVC